MDKQAVVGLAKALQFSYSNTKQASPMKWRDVDEQDRALWMKLARIAIRRASAKPASLEC